MPRSLHNEKKQKVKQKNRFYLVEFQRLIKNVNGLCDRDRGTFFTDGFTFRFGFRVESKRNVNKADQKWRTMRNDAMRHNLDHEHALAGVLKGAQGGMRTARGVSSGRRQQISVLDMLSLNGEIEQKPRQSADVEDLKRSVEWVQDELQMRCASATY